LASKQGLTTLAKFIADIKAREKNDGQIQNFLSTSKANISEKLEAKILKDYQKDAINEWKSKPENEGKSTLAYFAEHDQSGEEMILDLPNDN
jgi:post-segregation antitoxin (ccd killing protein)